ncbi:MAG: hypothetical protein ACHQ51_15985 [Elusimicrobiota bacterium]
MKPSIALFAVFSCLAVSGRAEPTAPPEGSPGQFSAADQKLIDRYCAALRAKFGYTGCAFANGSLTVAVPSGNLTVDLKDARSEDEIEERILKAAPPAEKMAAGESKIPVYFYGAAAKDLFKGAVAAADSKEDDAALAAKAAGSDDKALLDLKQGKITFPGSSQPEIVFKISDKPVRRVILRRGEDGALSATLDGEDYAYVAARVRGGKSERDPVTAGTASVFFEFNVWMQKNLKAADGRAEKEKAPKLSDGGYRHPSFEKLMAQVQGGLTADKLGQTFENAGAQAPANLEARAQAARELAASGYGGAARWKINSNGKYADANGNLTLLVRANGADGKIEETPVLVKKSARGGYDLAAAVEPVTKILLAGDVVGARAKAYQTAAAASPSEAVAEVSRSPALALTGTGAMGVFGSLAAPATAKAAPDAALTSALTRVATERKAEDAAVAKVCGGKPDCAPDAVVERPAVLSPANPPLTANVGCVINLRPSVDQQNALASSAEPPLTWMKEPPHPGAEGFTAVGCFTTRNRALLDHSKQMALMRLQSLVSCQVAPPPGTIVEYAEFKTTTPGVMGSCAKALVKTPG